MIRIGALPPTEEPVICQRCGRRRAVWSLYSESSNLLCGPCVLPEARHLITTDATDQRLILDLLGAQ